MSEKATDQTGGTKRKAEELPEMRKIKRNDSTIAQCNGSDNWDRPTNDRRFREVKSTKRDHPANDEVNEYNKDYQFADHDVVLISATTRLQFKVHSYRLKIGSQVFKDMIESTSFCLSMPPKRIEDGKIHLTDAELEDDPTLKLFLDCLYSRWESYFDKEKSIHINLESLLRLPQILLKYDCEGTKSAWSHVLRLAVTEGQFPPFNAFVIGSKCEDIELCVAAISTKSQFWVPVGGNTLRHGIKDARTLDLRAAPRDTFVEIPIRFSHALLQATYIVDSGKNSDMDWKAIAKEFKRLLEEENKAIEEEKAKKNDAEPAKQGTSTATAIAIA